MNSSNVVSYNLAQKSFLFFLLGLGFTGIIVISIVLQTNSFIQLETGKILIGSSFALLLPTFILGIYFGLKSTKVEGSDSLKNLLSLFGNSIFGLVFVLMILVNCIYALS